MYPFLPIIEINKKLNKLTSLKLVYHSSFIIIQRLLLGVTWCRRLQRLEHTSRKSQKDSVVLWSQSNNNPLNNCICLTLEPACQCLFCSGNCKDIDASYGCSSAMTMCLESTLWREHLCPFHSGEIRNLNLNMTEAFWACKS